MSGPVVVAGERLVLDDGAPAPGWLAVDPGTGLVTETGTGPAPSGALDLGRDLVVPGFVDVHHHGGGGAAYGGGVAAARTALAAHLRHGTTSSVASLVTERPDDLERQVRDLVPLVSAGELAGLHLEGPWLSPAHRGAHDPALLRDPLWPEVEPLLAAGEGAVRMVTLAPELPGGLESVRRMTDLGVVAAIGHTDATYDQARAAFDEGATVATHLFNAMRAVHHREPGPVVAALGTEGVWVELIADGVHLHPAVLAMAAAVKRGRVVLVTDAMAAAASADGDYLLGPLAVRVTDGVARLADSGAIAGSTLTMDAAVHHAVHVAGVPLVDALRAATVSPAAMLGLEGVGALRPGFRADLVVLDDDLHVRRVMRAGAWVAGAQDQM